MNNIQEQFDRHRVAIDKNLDGWRKPKTSRKRRLAKGQPVSSLIEQLADKIYGSKPVRETSERGDKKRLRRQEANARVSEARPPQHMHAHARRRHLAAEAEHLREAAE